MQLKLYDRDGRLIQKPQITEGKKLRLPKNARTVSLASGVLGSLVFCFYDLDYNEIRKVSGQSASIPEMAEYVLIKDEFSF